MVAVVAVLAIGAATVRWLRVAQREHYIPGSCLKIGLLWVRTRPPNHLLAGVTGAAAIVAVAGQPAPLAGAAAALAAVGATVFPIGMSLLGRDQRLVGTHRLVRLAGVAVMLNLLVVAAGAAAGWSSSALAALAVLAPLVVDCAAAVARPLETRLAHRYQTAAMAALQRVTPTTIAITGSYGKTSTKNHVRDLVAGTLSVVASPASWNNNVGLARTINEHLAPGTRVLVAEMGTYGAGEIRQMCSWIKPEIAVITAIGPMHLERMKTLDEIVKAKSEILDGVRVAILNVDHERLAEIADATALDSPAGPRVAAQVWRCGTRGQAGLDVSVDRDGDVATVRLRGEKLGVVDANGGLHLGNVACAVAAALAVGVPPADVATRIQDLSVPEHRAVHATTRDGLVVIDDTYNSNPTGSIAAVELLKSAVTGSRRRAVVTPGMVELGPEQDTANRELAAAVVAAPATLVVVGWTNRRSLMAGARGGEVVVVASRAAARDWVRAQLHSGDGVLWENDLPDHYP